MLTRIIAADFGNVGPTPRGYRPKLSRCFDRKRMRPCTIDGLPSSLLPSPIAACNLACSLGTPWPMSASSSRNPLGSRPVLLGCFGRMRVRFEGGVLAVVIWLVVPRACTAAAVARRDKQLRIPTDPVGAAVARAIADCNRCSITRRRVNPYRGKLAAVAISVPRGRLSRVLGAAAVDAPADCSRCNSLAVQGVRWSSRRSAD